MTTELANLSLLFSYLPTITRQWILNYFFTVRRTAFNLGFRQATGSRSTCST